MEKLTAYPQIARRVVERYASQNVSVGDVATYPMIDQVHHHYIAMQSGWVNGHRVHGAFVHLDVIGGKIWIQHDGTDRPVADELEAAGVPREDIVLAEKPPEVRPLTGYGVG
jgi:XisI protein